MRTQELSILFTGKILPPWRAVRPPVTLGVWHQVGRVQKSQWILSRENLETSSPLVLRHSEHSSQARPPHAPSAASSGIISFTLLRAPIDSERVSQVFCGQTSLGLLISDPRGVRIPPPQCHQVKEMHPLLAAQRRDGTVVVVSLASVVSLRLYFLLSFSLCELQARPPEPHNVMVFGLSFLLM